MDAASILRAARASSGLTLRALAAASGTSHATLSAYENERKAPTVETLDRILRAAGYATSIHLEPRADRTPADRRDKASELLDALELAAMFPVEHAATLEAPRFPGVHQAAEAEAA